VPIGPGKRIRDFALSDRDSAHLQRNQNLNAVPEGMSPPIVMWIRAA